MALPDISPAIEEFADQRSSPVKPNCQPERTRPERGDCKNQSGNQQRNKARQKSHGGGTASTNPMIWANPDHHSTTESSCLPGLKKWTPANASETPPPPANVRMRPQAPARRLETEILQRAPQSGRHRNAKRQPRDKILLGSINVEYQVKTGEQGPGRRASATPANASLAACGLARDQTLGCCEFQARIAMERARQKP